ncbi:blastula protease 10-like [Mytilus edulis]|uniref:blastula protease 10-like n=1 Tax=Mytilus edulis TaxID=6550 RepID=UPI0039EE3E04
MKFLFVLAIFIVCAGAVTIHQVKNTRQCKAEGGICKQTCAVDDEDTGPCCRNSYRCCQPTCIASVDCNCKSSTSDCHPTTEYQDNAGNCSGSDKCCKPCCLTCGGTFKGPEGRFTSPHYPSNYCNEQLCTYIIIVEEGSKVMLNFTFFRLEDGFFDTVKVYDGDIQTDTLMANLHGGPFEGLAFNSTSNKMIIVFTSDSSFVYNGFSAIYKTIK